MGSEAQKNMDGQTDKVNQANVQYIIKKEWRTLEEKSLRMTGNLILILLTTKVLKIGPKKPKKMWKI